MSWRLARRRSFFKSRDFYRVGLSHLGSWLTQSEPHLAEDSLALTHPERDAVSQTQVLAQEFAVPQVTGMAKRLRVASQVTPKGRPLFGIKRRRSPAPLALAHTFESVRFEPLDPAPPRIYQACG